MVASASEVDVLAAPEAVEAFDVDDALDADEEAVDVVEGEADCS